MARRVSFALVGLFALFLALVVGVHGQALTFSNTALLRPDGDSEPAIAIDPTGTMAISGLSWLEFGTNYWSGPFGSENQEDNDTDDIIAAHHKVAKGLNNMSGIPIEKDQTGGSHI